MEIKTRGRGGEETKLDWLCQFLEVGLTWSQANTALEEDLQVLLRRHVIWGIRNLEKWWHVERSATSPLLKSGHFLMSGRRTHLARGVAFQVRSLWVSFLPCFEYCFISFSSYLWTLSCWFGVDIRSYLVTLTVSICLHTCYVLVTFWILLFPLVNSWIYL